MDTDERIRVLLHGSMSPLVISAIIGADYDDLRDYLALAAPSALDVSTGGSLDAYVAGANPNGSTINTAAIQDMLDSAAGIQPVRFRAVGGGAYAIDNRVTIPSGTHLIFDKGAQLVVTAPNAASGTAMLYGSGTESAKTALTVNTAVGAMTVALPTGGVALKGFAKGDLIGLECTAIVTGPGGSDGYARELRRITSITGDTVELDGPLHYAYTTAASATYWKTTPLTNVKIEGLTVSQSGLTPGTDKSYALRLEKTLGLRVSDVTLNDMIGGVLLIDAYDSRVDGLSVNGLRSYADAYGYGLAAVASTTRLTVDGLSGSDNRHLFTTLADQRAGATFWGGPQSVQINGAIGHGSPGSFSIFDSHEFGRDIHFNGCIAIGGGPACSGFQVRAKQVQLNNCRSVRAGLRGVADVASSEGLEINGGTFSLSGESGVVLAGVGSSIQAATVRNNVGAGVGLSSTATDPTVQGCTILNNGNYGVQDSGATRPVVTHSNIPKSTTQTVAISNFGATGVAAHCTVLGYGGSTIPLSGIAATAKVHNLLTDNGPIGNQAYYLGTPTVSPNFDTPVFRGGSGTLRATALVRGEKGIQTVVVNTTGLTSAQIDTAVFVGVAAADGTSIVDATNNLILTRLAGKWYKTAALTLIA